MELKVHMQFSDKPPKVNIFLGVLIHILFVSSINAWKKFEKCCFRLSLILREIFTE